jgi:hypothetical protein
MERASGNDRIGIFQGIFVIGSEIAQISNELVIIWERIIVLTSRISVLVKLFQPRVLGRRGRGRGERIRVAVFSFAMEVMVAMMVRTAAFEAAKDLLESGHVLLTSRCWRIVHVRI